MIIKLRQNLGLRFLAVIVPVLICLVGLLLFAFDHFASNIVEELSIRFARQQVSYDRGRTLQPLLQEFALAQQLARSNNITDFALHEDDLEIARRGLAELESYRDAFKDKSYFFAIDKSGHYYFNDAQNSYVDQQLRYTLSPEKHDDAWYYATIKNPTECQINVNNDTELIVTKVWINCLVKSDGVVIGVVGTGIELTNFIKLVLNTEQTGVINMFVNSDGAIQAHPDTNLIDFASISKTSSEKKTIYRLVSKQDDQSRLRNILALIKKEPDRIITTHLEINGADRLVGIAYLPAIDWYNLTVITPTLWALGHRFLPLAGLSIIGMLLVLVLVAFVLHRLVLSRIRKLDHATKQLQANDYELDLLDNTPDEIGRLTASFVKMANSVFKDRRALEWEVNERTRELVATRDDADSANKAKSDFLAMMSHDLRTPLNAIIGFSSVIQAETFGPIGNRHYAEYIDNIKTSGEILLNLINLILDISKIEAGKFELQDDEVQLEPFLMDLIKLMSPLADAKNVSINSDFPAMLPSLCCDSRVLSQIIMNLLSNSIKFTHDNG